MPEISAADNIGALLTKYPFLIEPLLKKGLHCVGCSLRGQETLSQGLTTHGFTKSQIQETITELNILVRKVIPEQEKTA